MGRKVQVRCDNPRCGKLFDREAGAVNRAKRNAQAQYCSPGCIQAGLSSQAKQPRERQREVGPPIDPREHKRWRTRGKPGGRPGHFQVQGLHRSKGSLAYPLTGEVVDEEGNKETHRWTTDGYWCESRLESPMDLVVADSREGAA
ncbi:MAG: hypothetical protein ACLFQ3_09740 [Thiohalorhabdus sp.]